MYDVPIATIMNANNINDAQALEMGQELKILDAADYRPVIALFPSNKWQYIIIHHSGTDVGSSLAFHHAHLQKGWDKGVGYHFIIDNDSNGKEDGQIEASPRWIKQQDGAHCKASDMNIKGIGICLVGNFDQDRVSPEQLDSLAFLVKKLMEFYNIPQNRILGHGLVDGAATDCPGSRFPWDKFWQRLQ
jgi:N-acetyl-anhydromuramyl-L-alanine amidase AmpD